MTEYGVTNVPFKIEEEQLNFKLDGQYVVGSGADLPINYEDDNQLKNRPQINSNELKGNKTGEELGLQEKMSPITEQDIDEIMYGG